MCIVTINFSITVLQLGLKDLKIFDFIVQLLLFDCYKFS